MHAVVSPRIGFAVRAVLLVIAVAGVAELVLPSLLSRFRLGIDTQQFSCLPWRVYLIDKFRDEAPSSLSRGEIVQFKAGNIGMGFDGRLLVKVVAGLPGDRMEVRGDAVYVNGAYWGETWVMGKLGKNHGELDRVIEVPPGHYLLMSVARDSFDGRYWGVVSHDRLVGRAHPLA